MNKRKNRETDSFTVSFLDVASCGFGAMIILLMITKSSAPTTLEAIETVVPEDALPPEESVIVPPVELSCPLPLRDNAPARVRLPAPVSRARLFRLRVSFESVNFR